MLLVSYTNANILLIDLYVVVGGGVDYHVDSYVVKFAAGETSVPLNVMIIHDDLCEPNETFTLEIDQYSIMIEDVNVAHPYHTVVTIVDECKYSSGA